MDELKERVKTALYELALEQMTTGATELQEMQRITGNVKETLKEIRMLMRETTTELRGNRTYVSRRIQKYILHVYRNLFHQQFKSKPIVIYNTKIEGTFAELGNWAIVISNEMGIGIREHGGTRTKLIKELRTLNYLSKVHQEVAKRLQAKGFQKQAENLIKFFEIIPNIFLIADECKMKLLCEKQLCVLVDGKLETFKTKDIVFSYDSTFLENESVQIKVNPTTFNGWMCWQEIKQEWSGYIMQMEVALLSELDKTLQLRKRVDEEFGAYILGAKL